MIRVGTLVSLNVGLPVEATYEGRKIETGIYKTSTDMPIYLSKAGLLGDGQADLIHHGGEDKAVCVYSAEHYPYWEREWNKPLAPGAFGENFTVSALTETAICIGDIVRIGEAVVQVSQPRQPCFKLGMKHGRSDLPLLIQQTGYTGFYFRVLQEGSVVNGDQLLLEKRHPEGMTIAEANRVKYEDKQDLTAIRRIIGIPELSGSWRESFQERLNRLEG